MVLRQSRREECKSSAHASFQHGGQWKKESFTAIFREELPYHATKQKDLCKTTCEASLFIFLKVSMTAANRFRTYMKYKDFAIEITLIAYLNHQSERFHVLM